jgi:GAF domain-containing protein
MPTQINAPVFEDARYAEWYQLAKAILDSHHTLPHKLFALVRCLNTQVPHYNWTGFYWNAPDETRTLQLGAYEGEATEHTRIPFGRGICGQVAVSGRTFEVPDVATQDNYLACSLTTKAEIVVPVRSGGEVVGQLDIDSHTLNPFTPDDHLLLGYICDEVGRQLAQSGSCAHFA